MTQPTPPQYSADGRWWWDGYQWRPAEAVVREARRQFRARSWAGALIAAGVFGPMALGALFLLVVLLVALAQGVGQLFRGG